MIRTGEILHSKNRELPFSFFPVGKGNRRFGIFDVQFARNPWAVMQGAVNRAIASDEDRREALGYLGQAQDFYETAQGRMAAHPLLHYYAILNVGKTLLKVRSFEPSLETAHHGLTERSAGTAELENVRIGVRGKSVDSPRIFGEVLEALEYPTPSPGTDWTAAELMGQIVVGHRLWREASGGDERFVSIDDIRFMCDKNAKLIWVRFYIDKHTLSRHGIAHKSLLKEGGLDSQFVKVNDPKRANDYICFDQATPVSYGHRPTESVMDLVSVMRPLVWRIVSSVPGGSYRRNYLYLAPEGSPRVPQLGSMWALLFYLGSVVRYRPHRFEDLVNGPYGPFIDEFISAQVEQMLFLLASEMCRREIARPADI